MRRRTLAGLLAGMLLATLAACGSPKPGTFRPAGTALSGNTFLPASPAAGADGLTWPPFGPDVRIVMPTWRPGTARENRAVITAKDFLLAFLYAEYRGGRDQRWTSYVSGADVLDGLKSTLGVPGITTQSFRGTIRFSHMQAFPDPLHKGDIDVSECFNNSHSENTSLATGKVVPDHTPADQHYYLNTDVLARRQGRWHVVSVYPVIYYPRAKECGP
jgi:hypothetical protein